MPPSRRPPPETPATLGDLEQSEERLRDWFGRALTEETGAVQRAVVSEVRTLVAESEERTRALIAESEERTTTRIAESEERTRAFVVETVRESETRMTRVIVDSIRESEKRQDERLDARLGAFLTEVRVLIRDSEERTSALIRGSEERTDTRMDRIARRYDILFATLLFSLLGAALTVFVRWYSRLF